MRALLDLVFPPACLGCRAPGARWLCPACEAAFPWISTSCERCGCPAAYPLRACADCRALRPAFEVARAPAVYHGPAREALMAYKLGGERRAVRFLAPAMARIAAGLATTAVTFVPSTRATLRARAFDPPRELARATARLLGLPWGPALTKVRETADQAGLGRAARLRNVRDAFSARPVAGRVLLVDDVLTTGATVHACALALREAGAGAVCVVTFARAGPIPPSLLTITNVRR